jgi:hypothetical protein
LAALGRHEQALDASIEAVALRRTLADARPDTFTADLAKSLNNQSEQLAALGRHEEASAASTEAVALRLPELLDQWEPLLSAAAAAAGGQADDQTTTQITVALDELADNADWAALVPVLRRIISGDYNHALLNGLDEIDTAIATALLNRVQTTAT